MWEKRNLRKQTRIILFPSKKIHISFKDTHRKNSPHVKCYEAVYVYIERINGYGALLKWKNVVLRKLA